MSGVYRPFFKCVRLKHLFLLCFLSSSRLLELLLCCCRCYQDAYSLFIHAALNNHIDVASWLARTHNGELHTRDFDGNNLFSFLITELCGKTSPILLQQCRDVASALMYAGCCANTARLRITSGSVRDQGVRVAVQLGNVYPLILFLFCVCVTQ